MNTIVKKQSDVSADIFGSVLTLNFLHGRFIELDVSKLTEEMKLAGLLHGIKQKLVDAAAIARNKETGRTASIHDKFEAVEEVYNRLLIGQWNKSRGDGSGKGSKSYLAEALMELLGKTREQVTEFISSKTKEQLAALKLNPKVSVIINRLESAKVADVDTDAMLDELGDAPY